MAIAKHGFWSGRQGLGRHFWLITSCAPDEPVTSLDQELGCYPTRARTEDPSFLCKSRCS
jgi:hypothetical protein